MRAKETKTMAKRVVCSTSLDLEGLRRFKAIRKYVRAMCGPVSDAEVLRFLVWNWDSKRERRRSNAQTSAREEGRGDGEDSKSECL